MLKGTIALLLLAAAGPGYSQPPSFDAASIKPSEAATDNSDWDSWNSSPGYLVMKHQTFQKLVAIAYGFKDEQWVLGGPKWVESDRFDIVARAAGPAKDPELLLMLQTLLAERFQLVVHRETKNGAGYSLVPIKAGLKIQPDESEGNHTSNTSRGRIARIVAELIAMPKLAESLSKLLGVPVIDMTDAKGLYSFTLEWIPDGQNQPGSDNTPESAAPGPSLDDVLARELGLKLENRRLPADVIVIDIAEKPTEN
jgi:uncharacterized protein (TIGR03435 family)